MAGGLSITNDVKEYNFRVTWFVVLSCAVAATGGIIFGYDIGISGLCYFPLKLNQSYA